MLRKTWCSAVVGVAAAVVLVLASMGAGAQRGFRAFEAPQKNGEVKLRPGAPVMDTPIATEQLIVFLRPGTNPAAFAGDQGLRLVSRLRSDLDAYVMAAGSVRVAEIALPVVAADPRVRVVYPNMRTCNKLMSFVPNDPYFRHYTPSRPWTGQWHLTNGITRGLDAGVKGAWNRDITGVGTILAVVDDCLQIVHPDLAPNYVAADSWNFGTGTGDPSPEAGDAHGTSTGGVAAARGGNGIGVTGAAPYAGLAGLRIDFPNQTTAMFVDSTLYHSSGTNTNVKVKNHSYGIGAPYIAAQAEADAAVASAASGTIHCFSAGNERGYTGEDSNKKQTQAVPDVITVAALGSDWRFAWYSCYGACVFVTAPSSAWDPAFGITTTDRTGADGYNAGASGSFPDADYCADFGGTSSSSPLVAGVMALGKQVQPALDVRFAKHVLARTSSVIDPADVTTTSDGGWKTNTAGFRFNHNYGFGLVNANRFTNLAAQSPGGVSPMSTETSGPQTVGAAIPDNDAAGTSRSFNITSTVPVEAMVVTLNVTHAQRGDVTAFLTSPSGTTGRLMNSSGDTGDDIAWTFSTNTFWGENPGGTWTLRVCDVVSGTTGTWDSYQATARMGTLVVSPVHVVGVTVAPNTIRGSESCSGEVTINAPAPAGGQYVALGSDDDDVASVPVGVTVPEGATTAPFVVTGGIVHVDSMVEIGAFCGGTWVHTGLTVQDRYDISGTVREGGFGLAGATVTLSEPSTSWSTFSASAGLAIPDNNTTGVESTMTIGISGTIKEVRVGVNITHTWRGDLEASIIHPDGTAVLLHSRGGGSADDLVTSYPDLTAAVGDLTVFGGKPMAGTWRLKVRDLASSDTGTLNSWSLSLGTASAVDVASTTTDTEGRYAFVDLSSNTYTLTPSYSGKVFNPPFRVAAIGPSATGVDFDVTTRWVTGLSLNPATIAGGETSAGTVTISGPAPAGGIVVALSSDIPQAAVPASVTIPQGASSAPFNVTAAVVTTGFNATIKGVHGAVVTAPLTIRGKYAISGRVTMNGSGLRDTFIEAYGPVPGQVILVEMPFLPIPDGDTTGVESSVTVPFAATVTGVRVGVDITHTYIGDLEVSIIHPDGTQVILHRNTGGSADNIVTSYPDLTTPAQPLGLLNGKAAAGAWKLRVRDLWAVDTGTLNSWRLTIDYIAVGQAAYTYTAADGTYSVPELSPGDYTVKASMFTAVFAPATRSLTLGPSATGVDFERVMHNTTMNVLDRSGVITTLTTLRGYLHKVAGTVPLEGKTVGFKIDGTSVGSATTDATGRASLNWTIDCTPGVHTITGEFAGDDHYNPCSKNATLTATVVTTKVFVPARSGRIKRDAILRAYLYTLANVGIPGKTLSIKVDGTLVGSGVTDATGRVQRTYTVPEGAGAGARVIRGEWAGNAGYTASAANGTLTVTQGDLYIWVYVRSGKVGTSHPLKAYVRSLPDYAIQPGKAFTFRVNGTDVGSTTVAATGWAIVNWSIPISEPTGAHTASAVFAGDAWYLAQTKNAAFNVVP